MGIPGLTRKLEPYAERVFFHAVPAESRDVENELLAVIDGPALAYHVLSLCQAHKPSKNDLDDAPGYQQLADTTIVWLQGLTSHGFKVHAILFDGFLPWSKKGERMSRLQQSVDGLYSFRARNIDYQFGHVRAPRNTTPDLHQSLPSPSRTKIAAPVGFISAILDTLQKSQYGPVTRVVPGEADIFCAQSARPKPAYVLTGDSDLLVHDIGMEGKVAFFKDIEFSYEGGASRVSFLAFHPRAIADRLGLPNLVTMAYHANQDYHRSIVEAAALAKADVPSGPKFADFEGPFLNAIETDLQSSISTFKGLDFDKICDGLDPRVLEIALQLQITRNHRQHPRSDRTLYVFLPFLIDDPTKAAAHQSASDTRLVMFSLLCFIDAGVKFVSEYNRRGTAIAASNITLHDPDHMSHEMVNRAEHLSAGHEVFKLLPPSGRWRAMVAAEMLRNKIDSGRSLPVSSLVMAVVLNDRQMPLSWALVHLRAEVQARLYCYYLMKQILTLIFRLERILILNERETVALQQLAAALETLPGTAVMFDWQDCTKGMNAEDLSEVTSALLRLNNDESAEQSSSETVRKKRRKKKNKAHAPQTSQGPMARKSTNLFAALDQLND